MFTVKIIALLFCVVAGRVSAFGDHNDSTIIGYHNEIATEYANEQRPVNLGEVGFVVSLRANNNHFCSASILNRYWMVTSARCVQNRRPNTIAAYFGAHQLRDGLRMGIYRIRIHPQYDADTTQNDIAMLRASSVIPNNPRIRFIAISNDDFANSVRQMHVAGWGMIHVCF